jgi:hypothetical protein
MISRSDVQLFAGKKVNRHAMASQVRLVPAIHKISKQIL